MPTLRFPGFTEEWQKSALGDICIVQMCKRIFAHQTSQVGDVPFYKIGTIGGIPDSYISKELFDEYRCKYNYPQQGEVMITCAGTVGKAIPFDGVDSYFQDSNIVWLSNPTDQINNKFLYYIISRVEWSRLNSTTITRIYNDDLRKLGISYPNRTEQKKIADFLSLLDERIALQSKLIEDLKKLKSAIVERMLQQETESTVILSSLGRFIRGVTYSTEDITDGDGTLVMRATNITTGSPLNFKSDVVTISKRVSKEQLIATNDIVICLANGSSALIGKNSVYDGGCLSSLTIGAFCGVFRPNHSFVKWLFQTSQYRTNVARSIQGGNGAIANLSPSDILTMKFALPNDDVLNMYDNLLNKIDDKLVTETKLLDDILNQKCYLLSAMFI